MGSGVAPDLLVTDKSNRRLPPAAGQCHYSIVIILNYRDSVNFESRNLRFRHQPLLSSSKPQASQLKPSSKPGPGRRDEVIDRSYRFAKRVSTRTRAADQPDGLSGVSPPINRGCNTHLQGGFPLRCFQRLSLPHLATQRWPERANWRTRGGSLPILSY